jgi:hypothetical protein
MTSVLTVLVGDFNGQDAQAANVLEQWAENGLIRNIAWGNISNDGVLEKESFRWACNNKVVNSSMYDILGSRIWETVTYIPLRSQNLGSISTVRFQVENECWKLIEDAFSAHKDLNLRGISVSICDFDGLVDVAFSPYLSNHLVHEPRVFTDMAVASRPIDDASRPLIVALLACGIGGAFRWQENAENWQIDHAIGGESQIRVARVLMRAVTAGRVPDEILRGAFPESGPWSVPPDIPGAQSVPPGTWLEEATLKEFVNEYSFTSVSWVAPKIEAKRDEEIGIFAGLKLFAREFVDVIRGFPNAVIIKLKRGVEEYIQNVTLGADSALRLKFDPRKDLVDPTDAIEAIRELRLSSGAPINDPVQWENLTKICLSSVDGGSFPQKVTTPVRGPKRLIFVDPQVVGPSVDDSSFFLSALEQDVLQLPIEYAEIKSLDVVKAEGFNKFLQNLKLEIGINEQSKVPQSEKTSANVTQDVIEPTDANAEEVATTEVLDRSRHLPTHPKFNSREYFPLTPFYQGERVEVESEYGDAQVRYKELLAKHDVSHGYWEQDKGCDLCGTSFHHGVLFLHEPTNEVVHVGHICAKKWLPLSDEHQLIVQLLVKLERRWREWLSTRTGSILWRTAESISRGISDARVELDSALTNIEKRPHVNEQEEQVRTRLAKWTRRGFLVLLLILAASVATILITALPLLLFAAIIGSYFFSLMVRLVFLARALAREKFKREAMTTVFESSIERAQHATSEIERLASVYKQFDDWQMILREISHRPFGSGAGFQSLGGGTADINRPASFVVARAKPSQEQLTHALLRAKRQTVHAGWLHEIYLIQRRVWESRYELVCFAGGDSLAPEADNAPAESVRTKAPITNEDVFYPRTDFRKNLCTGTLSDELVAEKAQVIAEELAQMRVSDLLGDVEVVGEGSALNGRPIDRFLGDLAQADNPDFDPDVFGVSAPHMRVNNIEMSIPRVEDQSTSTFGTVKPGEELTAAVMRIDLSPAISGSSLRGWSIRTETAVEKSEQEDFSTEEGPEI